MRTRFSVAALLLAAAMLLGMTAGASNKSKDDKDVPKDTSSSATAPATVQDENMRMEGEKRFRSNCARCHTAPPKFPPRMMATIVRHMRVRAAITDQDMRLILRYMTE
jgi:mono/diheme cytochrome c family protein